VRVYLSVLVSNMCRSSSLQQTMDNELMMLNKKTTSMPYRTFSIVVTLMFYVFFCVIVVLCNSQSSWSIHVLNCHSEWVSMSLSAWQVLSASFLHTGRDCHILICQTLTFAKSFKEEIHCLDMLQRQISKGQKIHSPHCFVSIKIIMTTPSMACFYGFFADALCLSIMRIFFRASLLPSGLLNTYSEFWSSSNSSLSEGDGHDGISWWTVIERALPIEDQMKLVACNEKKMLVKTKEPTRDGVWIGNLEDNPGRGPFMPKGPAVLLAPPGLPPWINLLDPWGGGAASNCCVPKNWS
jgi:hypothetical protein